MNADHGFWIDGSVRGDRRLVNAAAAFAGFASCEPARLCAGECYLSAFIFGDAMRVRVVTGDVLDVTGYADLCGAHYVWWDIDREQDLQAALEATRTLCLFLADQFRVPEDEVLVFFSGSKGFHVGIPTTLWAPSPSLVFSRVTRRFAEGIAAAAGVAIDSSVYDSVRAFRAPNSRHPKTGLHKRCFTVKELLAFDLPRVLEDARRPAAFEVSTQAPHVPHLAEQWRLAEEAVAAESAAHARRREAQAQGTGPTLNRLTREIIRTGAPLVEPNRHRLLYSAARNLAECGYSLHAAIELLTEPGLDSGLPPKEVRRQIECGFKDHGRSSND